MQITSYQREKLKEELPHRQEDSNKGDYGKLLLIAGSCNMCGAAYLAAKAAYRAGTGLVYIYTEECNRIILQERIPEAVLYTYSPEHWEADQLEEIMKGKTAIAVGPGLGQSHCAEEITRAVLRSQLSKVVDADALNLLAKHPAWYEERNGSMIVTPHPAEMSRLSQMSVNDIQADRHACAKAYAKMHHVIMVLKGSHTIVTDGTDEYINDTGNHGMATAGSGDVLTGIIGGFLAQHMMPFEAARLGVYVHGLAGDDAKKERGTYSMMASDIVEHILYGIE